MHNNGSLHTVYPISASKQHQISLPSNITPLKYAAVSYTLQVIIAMVLWFLTSKGCYAYISHAINTWL